MILISVIIPCFNAAPWIEETLKSAQIQGVPDMEIIVVDDGSVDNSIKIIQEKFPFVRLINIKNQGASKARNLGTEVSKGEFIQYLDADDLLMPGKLKIQLEALNNSGADVAYGDWQKLVRGTDENYKRGEEVKRKIQNPEIDLFTDFWCPPAVYLFRRSIIERVGGWNVGLPIIQDARLVLDCALQGAKFVYCPGIMAYYTVHHKESLSTKDFVGFIRDCLRNAQEVEEWWSKHQGIDRQRRRALLKVYGYVARESFKEDKPTFESAYKAASNLLPFYVPEKLKVLNLLSRVYGYRKAEAIVIWYRKIRDIFKRSVTSF